MWHSNRLLGLAGLVLLVVGAIVLILVDGEVAVEHSDVHAQGAPEPMSTVPPSQARPRTPAVADPQLLGRRSTPLWRRVGPGAVGQIPDYPSQWSKEGRVLVDVSGVVAAAPSWSVGDRLSVELPQLGASYESVIERVDEGRGHARSAFGLVAGTDGTSRRLILTVGPGRVFAYVDTPDGSYELTANDRLGWLLPSSSMMAGFDYSEPDYWLPKRGERIDEER